MLKLNTVRKKKEILQSNINGRRIVETAIKQFYMQWEHAKSNERARVRKTAK